MAKRRADKELTHDNWQDEDEDDQDYTGPFKKASAEEMAKRKIKTARRRGVADSSHSEPAATGVFKSFSGFGAIGSSGSSKFGSFNFKPTDSTFNKPVLDSSVKTSACSTSSTGSTFSFQTASSTSVNKSTISEVRSNGLQNKPDNASVANAEGNNKAYLSNLRALNEGVLKWIKKHLDQNINVNLMPVFDDYKKHFEELEKKYKPKFAKKNSSIESSVVSNGSSSDKSSIKTITSPIRDTNTSITQSKKHSPSTNSSSFFASNISKDNEIKIDKHESPSKTKEASAPVFSFGKTSAQSDSGTNFAFPSAASKPVATFSFGSDNSNKNGAEKSTPTFSFGGNNSISTGFGGKEGGFSFNSGGSSTFSFGGAGALASIKPPAPSSTTEDDYTPPKAEILEVKEDDAIYEKKCKLFYKNDNAYVDKGVGTLFLKPVSDGKKTQLVVRAATSLGNVLLNILLSSSMPTQRTGKNNVLIVCVPNPPIDPKAEKSTPVPMLIRVKTSEDADELLKKIDELKNQ